MKIRMKIKSCTSAVLVLGVLLLAGCSEGATVSNVLSTSLSLSNPDVIENGIAETQNMVNTELYGGTYQIESWSLVDSPKEAGLEAVDMSPTVAEDSYENMTDMLLVTMRFTSTPDVEGRISDTTLLNKFLPITKKGLDSLMGASSDSDQSQEPLYGSEAVYLNVGHTGQSNYFEIDTPEQDESIIFVLGYQLTGDEYLAATNGDLFLLLTAGGLGEVESLHLLLEQKK